ncbi:MAG TPA: oligosaccharide flippase family protein [Gallionellaceae bacterium]
MKVKRNMGYGLLGFALPTLVMLLSIPVLIAGLGKDGFGIFTLAASVGGSFGFLDLGFSAATTKYVAADLSRQRFESANSILYTSLAFYGALAALIVFVVWIGAPVFVKLFSIPIALSDQATAAFRIAAFQFGFFLLVGVFISLFKAIHRFDAATSINTFIAIVSYGGAALAVKMHMVGIVGATLIGMLANAIALIVAYAVSLRIYRTRTINAGSARPSLSSLRRMFSFSATLTIHSLAAVFFAQFQRLIIGYLLGPASVAIYQVAYAAVSKIHALVNAATEVIFPIVSASGHDSTTQALYLRTISVSALTAILLLLPLGIFAGPIVELWIGREVAVSAAPVLQILTIAFFFITISSGPYHILNGMGRPIVSVLYSAGNVCIYMVTLFAFSLGGISLTNVAWTFAISNVISGLIFQLLAMRLIMRL